MSASALLGQCTGCAIVFVGIAYFFCWIWGIKKKRYILFLVFFLSFGVYSFKEMRSYKTEIIEKNPEMKKNNHQQINSKVDEFHLRFNDPNYAQSSTH